ncbi:MAG TPA: hypothetical protein VFX27_10535 [Sphingobium sp.]|nr:hypothetical protein [Sphingobium sp.]
MTRVFVILAALGAATIASPALADDDARLSVGITGGTLGIGPEIGYRLSKNFGVRANASFLSISHNIDSDNITYDGKVKLQSGGAMVDVYPFGGGFRVSGGVRINGNKARGIGTPTGGTFDINGTSYDATTLVTSVRADTDIEDVAPALTLGYGGGTSSGLIFGVEAGALFQGSVKIKPLTISGTCATSTAGPCANIAADLEAERQSVNDDIDGYKVYPILQVTVGYRF